MAEAGTSAPGRHAARPQPDVLSAVTYDGWVQPGTAIEVAGLSLAGGMLYVGKKLCAPADGGSDPALIDPWLLTVYTTSDVAAYLDAKAVRLLAEGRANFARFGLGSDPVLEWGADTLIFPWRGGRVMCTLAVALTAAGANAALDGVCLTMTAASRPAAIARLQSLADSAPDPLALAASVKNKIVEKYDEFLSDELLSIACAASSLDVDGAWHTLASLLNQVASQTSSSPIAGA